ncbi:hypothetical protein IWW45_000952 [Coemansia sp. RSA 485]|nr:hypothetical protein IWW45_000952 [Coemansia sp. RSA 485]
MNEFGVFIKSQTSKRTKKNIRQLLDAKESDTVILTNLEPKNYPLIKALWRFVSCRELFWSDEYSVPADPLVYAENALTVDMEPCSDIERWLHAMIRRHGRPMVDYFDTCARNLVNSYLFNLVEWGEKPMLEFVRVNTTTQRKYLVEMLEKISYEARAPPASRPTRIPRSIYSMRVLDVRQQQQAFSSVCSSPALVSDNVLRKRSIDECASENSSPEDSCSQLVDSKKAKADVNKTEVPVLTYDPLSQISAFANQTSLGDDFLVQFTNF